MVIPTQVSSEDRVQGEEPGELALCVQLAKHLVHEFHGTMMIYRLLTDVHSESGVG